MHDVLEGHNSPFKVWVPPKVTNFLSSPFLNQPKNSRPLLNWGGGGGGGVGVDTDTMKFMYFIQLTTSTDCIIISVRFFQ